MAFKKIDWEELEEHVLPATRAAAIYCCLNEYPVGTAPEKPLTDWEEDFLDSIITQNRVRLSDKQDAVMAKLETRYFGTLSAAAGYAKRNAANIARELAAIQKDKGF